ncbi:MAG: metal-dependent hydrolase [Saprospirales bacterium]|nr:metal-dependent hydrolase [Saprospirales bacterium]MBK8923287.1 metal-dependent hydrolase [Saprospirales bacterium]
MDSLTQIVLGAACGEAVAGRKLGNRAMMWGAIGGTIPDLDVVAELFTDRMAAMAFHRGFMHSMVFAAVMPWILARLTMWFYSQGVYQLRGYKLAAMLIWLVFFLGAAAGLNFIPIILGEGLIWYVFVPTLLLGAWFTWRLWKDYWRRDLSEVQAPYLTWVALFFWSIFTHPILDCFTNFGTQIWQPFSDLRVQWTTVSVVDPVYTVPFGLCLVVAARFERTTNIRRYLSWAGILWGCGYLGYTCWHKHQAGRLFEQALQSKEIRYQRYMTGPSILNNIVWYGVAEGDTAMYYGMASFSDCRPGFDKISTLPKNRHLLEQVPYDDKAYRFLRWFTNGYYDVVPRGPDTVQVNDLRFGLLGDTLKDENYVFPFLLYKNEQGAWDIYQRNRAPQGPEAFKASISELWQKIQGVPCNGK